MYQKKLMKNILLITLLLSTLSLNAQISTDEIDLYYSFQQVEIIQVRAANGTACTAEVIDECGQDFITSNYGESSAGNAQGWYAETGNGANAQTVWFYNDLDNNNNTFFSPGGQYSVNLGNNGNPNWQTYSGDVGYSVENDIFYTFCPTALGSWNISIAPSNCATAAGVPTTLNGFQYAVFEGADCSNFGSGLLAGGGQGQDWLTTQVVPINVTSLTNCIFIEIDGYAGTQCDFAVSLSPPPGGCLLPIELTSFNVKNKNQTNTLEWITTSESNNDYFTIERSENGITFEEIGRIGGAGNSSDRLSYQFDDHRYSEGINYYRLKQTDYNGNYEYSDLFTIDNSLNSPAKLLTTINLMGQEVDNNYRGVRVLIYSDGTRVKKIGR